MGNLFAHAVMLRGKNRMGRKPAHPTLNAIR